jgi:hypothetical protein
VQGDVHATPSIVSERPVGAVVIVCGTKTENETVFPGTPFIVITTFPVVAVAGTGTVMLVALHEVGLAATPLKVIVVVPWAAPKLDPAIVTLAPDTALLGVILVMFAGTVNVTPLLATPSTLIMTFPVDVPAGTVAETLVVDHDVGVTEIPLNVTAPEGWIPKLLPEIVTAVPVGPEVGEIAVIVGGGVTVKGTPELAFPATVTTTLPADAPAGTVVMICEEVQLLTEAAVPLNVTVLVPWVAPKVVPVIVTAPPTGAEVIDRAVIFGVMVKLTPELATPLAVTTMFPVVAADGTVATMLESLQLFTEAAVPLNVTVPVPWVAPNVVPVIVTDVPTLPALELREVMFGRTVKLKGVLETPPTVTTIPPVVAPTGTGAVMLPALHVVGVAAVPLKVNVLVPWVAPKDAPVMVTDVPTAAEAGETLVIEGKTVKLTPLLACPATVTRTFPVVAPEGTVTVMLDAPQLVAVAAAPLNVTVLVPWVAPKVVPVIVTAPPTGAEVIDRAVIFGVMVKLTPELATPLAVTTMFPVVAADGTVATMLESLQLFTEAAVPLNVTVPVPWVAPNVVPVIVTDVPTLPALELREVMFGRTVKLKGVLETPPTVTTIPPVVAPTGTGAVMLPALHVVGVAAVPLKVNVLVPWVAPKDAPVMVTDVPTAAEAGETLVIEGKTVKLTPLLACPATVTRTFPVVAPEGTVTVMLDAPQLVAVAAAPLNVTVLVPWVAPKVVPEIVTAVPIAAELADRPVIFGTTVKLTALLVFPATDTVTLPVVAFEGTETEILLPVHELTVADTPLNDTTLVPCVAPNVVPAIVTDVPTGPDVRLRELMWGRTVNAAPLLAIPPTVTTTFPEVALAGTVAEMLEAVQELTLAATPLKVAVLLPCELPKFDPNIATEEPTKAVAGESPLITGPV